MKLRKLDWWEAPKPRPIAVTNNNPVSVLPLKETVREVIREVAQPTVDVESLLKPLKDEVEKLKKRKPEYFPGGSGSVGSYHRVTDDVKRFAKNSFNPGINVIGVASGVPTTIWLPQDLEHNHLVAVKDELGIAAQQPITVRVYT